MRKSAHLSGIPRLSLLTLWTPFCRAGFFAQPPSSSTLAFLARSRRLTQSQSRTVQDSEMGPGLLEISGAEMICHLSSFGGGNDNHLRIGTIQLRAMQWQTTNFALLFPGSADNRPTSTEGKTRISRTTERWLPESPRRRLVVLGTSCARGPCPAKPPCLSSIRKSS